MFISSVLFTQRGITDGNNSCIHCGFNWHTGTSLCTGSSGCYIQKVWKRGHIFFTEQEQQRILAMIYSPDKENHVMAIELLNTK